MVARRYILCQKRGHLAAQCDDQRAVGSVRSIIINRFAMKKQTNGQREQNSFESGKSSCQQPKMKNQHKTKKMAKLRVKLLLRQLIYQPNPLWCCKLEQPLREGMCFKGGASPYFIQQCKPTYLRYEGSKGHTLPKDREFSDFPN